MLQPDFERRLIENTQPIRFFFLAQALHHALDLGLFTTLGHTPGRSVAELSAEHGLDEERLLGLLRYLQNEGYLVDNGGWRLTAKSVDLPVFAPWYEMLVGGYAPSMQQLGDVLKKDAPWATRDATKVGAGSCGIGAYDAMPLVETLLGSADRQISTIIDLGCGDSAFLIDLLVARPGLRGVGMDPNRESIEIGTALGAARGVADRLELRCGTAGDVVKLDLPDRGRGTCFMTAFVLQEVLEQEGEPAVEELLKQTFDTYPEALWLVVEMDHRPTSPIMAHGLALAFYNPYFLIHAITEQRLETREYWAEMFERVGLRTLRLAHPDDRADSTGLQFGYLLGRP
jgi:2-ketoarginine methyltransferase